MQPAGKGKVKTEEDKIARLRYVPLYASLGRDPPPLQVDSVSQTNRNHTPRHIPAVQKQGVLLSVAMLLFSSC